MNKETRQKISKTLRGRKVGPHSVETRLKISEANKGKKLSFETRQKLSKVNRGKKLSFEVRQKMSQAKKGKKNGPHSPERLRRILSKICQRPNTFEQNALNYLNAIYDNKFKYVGDGSFMIEHRSVDAYSEELKTVALFHGTYFHCSPRKYGPDYFNTRKRMFAKDIWSYDADCVRRFMGAGYKVIVVWEDELIEMVI